ncbi:MAG: hypothetical protein AAGH15_23140 [Myxococcota bacterium]
MPTADELEDTFRIVLRQGANQVATWRNLVLAHWSDTPGPEPMRAIHESHLALLHRHAKVGHLVLIRGGPKRPTPEAREVASRYSQQSRMSSIAIVLEAEGFWGGAARAFLTAVLFLSRSEAPTQLFGDIESALDWQAGVLGEHAPPRAEAADALAQLRRLASEAPPRMRG